MKKSGGNKKSELIEESAHTLGWTFPSVEEWRFETEDLLAQKISKGKIGTGFVFGCLAKMVCTPGKEQESHHMAVGLAALVVIDPKLYHVYGGDYLPSIDMSADIGDILIKSWYPCSHRGHENSIQREVLEDEQMSSDDLKEISRLATDTVINEFAADTMSMERAHRSLHEIYDIRKLRQCEVRFEGFSHLLSDEHILTMPNVRKDRDYFRIPPRNPRHCVCKLPGFDTKINEFSNFIPG